MNFEAGARAFPTRTFHPRRGRMTPGRLVTLAELRPRFGLVPDDRPLDHLAVFGRLAPLVVEIGFGMGEATAQRAALEPHLDVLAFDVHTPGVANLLRLLEGEGSTNVRVVEADALEALPGLVRPASLTSVRVLFPDPWPKIRQQRRRLVRPENVAMLAGLLVSGGRLEMATDWADYATQMLTVVDAEPLLRNPFDGPAPRPSQRPITKFEARAHREGRVVVDVVAERR